MPDNQLYDILGVSRSASQGEIRKAYHKQAKKYHPDKSEADEEKIKEINFAYEILQDAQKRETYDRYGLEALKESGGGGPGGMGGLFEDLFSHGGGGFGGGGIFGGGGSPFDGLFGGMGGMGGGGRMRGNRKRRGEDTVHPLQVSLEDLYNGKVSKLALTRTILCKKCNGVGGKAGSTRACNDCHGRGVKVTVRQLGPGMIQQMQGVCPSCHGEGEVIAEKDRCKTCKGTKTEKEKKILEVHVDKGMRHGQRIPFRQEGDVMPDTEPGDVIVVLQQKEHETFVRKGDDLVCERKIKLVEALCGLEFHLKHLDARDLVVKTNQGEIIQPGAMKCVENEGMPFHKNPFEKGNLVIKFEIEFPEQRFANENSLKQLEKLLPKRPEFAVPSGDSVEQVDMIDFDASQFGNERNFKEAYDSESDDDGRPPGAHHVQCAHQ